VELYLRCLVRLSFLFFRTYTMHHSRPASLLHTSITTYISKRTGDLIAERTKALYELMKTTPRKVRYFHVCHDYIPEVTNTPPSHRIVKMPYATYYSTRQKITPFFSSCMTFLTTDYRSRYSILHYGRDVTRRVHKSGQGECLQMFPSTTL
jgi:hypothetical protein